MQMVYHNFPFRFKTRTVTIAPTKTTNTANTAPTIAPTESPSDVWGEPPPGVLKREPLRVADTDVDTGRV